MNRVRELHNQAMRLADLALEAKFQGNQEDFEKYSAQAYELEAAAAEQVRFELEAEPTRSVLYRSAATLALDCKKYEEALRLIEIGLGGNPQNEIAQELRDLREQVDFYRHLETRGISLQRNEMQFSIAGDSTAPGMTLSEVFVSRIQSLQKMIQRTVERLAKLSYSEVPRVLKSYDLLLSAPRAGSFALTLQLGTPSQLILPGFEEIKTPEPEIIIDELLKCLEAFNEGNEEKLKTLIEDENYYRNFVGLARNLAPDGQEVKSVSFTPSNLNSTAQPVSLNVRRADNPISIRSTGKGNDTQTREQKLETLVGFLRFADAKSQKKTIKIVQENDEVTTIVVPGGMDDIVRSMWERQVTVKGFWVGKALQLTDIEEVRN